MALVLLSYYSIIMLTYTGQVMIHPSRQTEEASTTGLEMSKFLSLLEGPNAPQGLHVIP